MTSSVLECVLDVLVEKRDDRWVATLPELGLVVYGDSESAVLERLTKAEELLFETFGDNLGKLRRYLDHQGIPHSFQNAYSIQNAYETTRRVKVPVGALHIT